MTTESLLIKAFTDRGGVVAHAALTDLRKSGLSDETILANVKLFTGKREDLKRELGYSKMNGDEIIQNSHILEFPYINEDGTRAFSRFKPVPQLDPEKKYLHPFGTPAIPYITSKTWAIKNKVSVPIWITEGEKKALKLEQEGRHCIALPGIWAFKAGKNSNQTDACKEMWPQLRAFNWAGRLAYLAYDMDLFVNPNIRMALFEISVKIIAQGGIVAFPVWNEGKGIDDYLVSISNAAHAIGELERGAISFGQFVRPEYQHEAIRAVAITNLSPIRYDQIVSELSKSLKVKAATIKLEVREFRGKNKVGGIDEFFEKFYQIKGRELIIDRDTGDMMSPKAFLLEYPVTGKIWKETEPRKTIDLSKIVFKPQGCAPDEINLFKGLDLTPSDAPCTNILKLLKHLCQDDEGLEKWVTCWLAYPILHVGAKMKTTLIVQGTQGSGKSKFFEEVMREIYREYFSYITQEQLEEKFNEWMSHRLFVCGDEVIANKNLGKVKNTLKSYITQPTFNIRKMREPARSEENHANFVFLSNEDVPVLVDSDDRRHVVMTVDQKVDLDIMRGVDQELANGGAKGLIKYLLSYDIGDFNEHSPAYQTTGKQALQSLCEKAPEKFMKAWQSGELDLPYCSCEKVDLYVAFQLWFEFNREFGDTGSTKLELKIDTMINRGIIPGVRDGKINYPSETSSGKTSKRAWIVDLPDWSREENFPGLFNPTQEMQGNLFKKATEAYKKMVVASKAF